MNYSKLMLGVLGIALTCVAAPSFADPLNPTDEQLERACADVGLEPGSGAFQQCVLNLQTALWEDANGSNG